MIDRTTRLRWRRRIRRSRLQVEDMGVQAEEHIERHFFRRLARLTPVRRFIVAWVLLVVLLISTVFIQARALGNYYLADKPAPGGIFTEGMVGAFTNANPLYATSAVDSSVAKLVFAGLFKFDDKNQLVGDLASTFEVDERGVQYTVHLRDNLHWQDGKDLTADDIVFTYQTIQNPDAKSPFLSSWQGVKIAATDDRTIVFSLPNALSAFPFSLTNGIVPKHLLNGIPASQLRAVSFNTTSPVGAGPFKWDGVDVTGNTPETHEQTIGLVPNSDYHGGTPKLSKFIIRSFHAEKRMIDSFRHQELSALAGMTTFPEELRDDHNLTDYNIPLTGEVLVFLKNSDEVLKDLAVRRALVEATDSNQIITGLDHPVIASREPILQGIAGYDKNVAEFPTDVTAAAQILDQAGWKLGTDGLRSKDGKPLKIHLYSQANSEYAYVAQTLQKQWRRVGVDTEVILQTDSDLQTTINLHAYGALLYGISIGPDPDVFAYWHSSQADIRSANRLNFSEYRSGIADKSLEAGRTRTDATIRGIKYRPFLEAWRNDAPAIALYQPRYLYISRVPIAGFSPQKLNTGSDRYSNVENWMIRVDRKPQS